MLLFTVKQKILWTGKDVLRLQTYIWRYIFQDICVTWGSSTYIIVFSSISFDIIPSTSLDETLHVCLDYFLFFRTPHFSCETNTVDRIHFLSSPLNFISKILTNAIYNLSGESLGNWKKVKNNDVDNGREMKDRDGVFISKEYLLQHVSVSSNTTLNAQILFCFLFSSLTWNTLPETCIIPNINQCKNR
jgi:hypothetical protein